MTCNGTCEGSDQQLEQHWTCKQMKLAGSRVSGAKPFWRFVLPISLFDHILGTTLVNVKSGVLYQHPLQRARQHLHIQAALLLAIHARSILPKAKFQALFARQHGKARTKLACKLVQITAQNSMHPFRS